MHASVPNLKVFPMFHLLGKSCRSTLLKLKHKIGHNQGGAKPPIHTKKTSAADLLVNHAYYPKREALLYRSFSDVVKGDKHVATECNEKPLWLPHKSGEAPCAEPLVFIVPARRRARNLAFFLSGVGAAGALLVAATMVSLGDEHEHQGGLVDLLRPLSGGVVKLAASAAEVGRGALGALKGSSDAVKEMLNRGAQASLATVVLAKCLYSVLITSDGTTSAPRSRWRLKVVSLLADLAGASGSRRKALAAAGNGVVLDWLLKALSHADPLCRTLQAEAARAIAHLLLDPSTCESVLARPHALLHLLSFTASVQPRPIEGFKKKKLQFEDMSESFRGRSLLVGAIMEIITSSCERDGADSFRPRLPKDADEQDIAAALKVIEEGGLQADENRDADDDSEGDTGGLKGIGMKVLGGTGITSGLQRVEQAISLRGGVGVGVGAVYLGSHSKFSASQTKIPLMSEEQSALGGGGGIATSHGLWDDLHGRYVAVPLAAWAVANWAQTSDMNRARIMDLDKNGDALLAAIMAPERTVRWHGASIVASLLDDGNLSVDEVASVWSPALLEAAVQANGVDDASLALTAASAFASCLKESANAQKVILEKGLPIMRSLASQSKGSSGLHKALSESLEILTLGEKGIPREEGKRWSGILLQWVFNRAYGSEVRSSALRVLERVMDDLGHAGIPISQTFLVMLMMEALNVSKSGFKEDPSLSKSKEVKSRGTHQMHTSQAAIQAATQLSKIVLQIVHDKVPINGITELPYNDLTRLDCMQNLGKSLKRDSSTKVTVADGAFATLKAVKALTEICAENKDCQQRVVDAGGIILLRRLILSDDYEQWAAAEAYEASKHFVFPENEKAVEDSKKDSKKDSEAKDPSKLRVPPTAHIRKHAARLLSILTLERRASDIISSDSLWIKWLEECANGSLTGCDNFKTASYARTALLNAKQDKVVSSQSESATNEGKPLQLAQEEKQPQYEDSIFLLNTESSFWHTWDDGAYSDFSEQKANNNKLSLDVVFVHGLCGGPFKTWRVANYKSPSGSTSEAIENFREEIGGEGACWPKTWLAKDLPNARLLTVKYKTNLSQWSGATLPLQEVSSMLLKKLLAAGVGERPVVFITHSMGGLVVKQMLLQAEMDKACSHLVKQTSGIVFYSCPHFGSKLADVPFRIGLLLRPAPTIGELRSQSPRLEELNQFIRSLHKNGLDVLSFSETKVTPLVEGYGGWALRMEVVPIESAYPGFGELVVLDDSDHVNSCKPLNRNDPAYTATLNFLQKLRMSNRKSFS